MIFHCKECGAKNQIYGGDVFEEETNEPDSEDDRTVVDAETGEILPNWLVDARGIMKWDTESEPALLRWQDEFSHSNEEMQDSVDGLINSERLSGPKPKGYASPVKALQRRVRMGYDRPQKQQDGRYPKKASRY